MGKTPEAVVPAPLYDWLNAHTRLIASVPHTTTCLRSFSLELFAVATTTTDDPVKPTRYAFPLSPERLSLSHC